MDKVKAKFGIDSNKSIWIADTSQQQLNDESLKTFWNRDRVTLMVLDTANGGSQPRSTGTRVSFQPFPSLYDAGEYDSLGTLLFFCFVVRHSASLHAMCCDFYKQRQK
jgi:hypothetical protein